MTGILVAASNVSFFSFAFRPFANLFVTSAAGVPGKGDRVLPNGVGGKAAGPADDPLPPVLVLFAAVLVAAVPSGRAWATKMAC